ncbi:ABC transporter substrate-binding protein [Microtetraspora niveoalba]|uniref:ABC transporter substrate-binding protein n=1 Tax=Microtetraspora niveoalba TaxID=46175 RepID=UPI000A0688CF|nr:extracellular solute-binding protein [Microtetraspora niveoalba]
MRLKLRASVALGGLLITSLLAACGSGGGSAGGGVVLGVWGGGVDAVWTESFLDPYAKSTGADVSLETIIDPEATITSQAGNPKFNVLVFPYWQAAKVAQEKHLISTVDAANLPALKEVDDRYLPVDEKGELVGVPVYFLYFGIGYNTKNVDPSEIDSWLDLTDRKWKGRASMQLPGFVAANDLVALNHAAGGSDDDLGRGLGVLKDIAPNLLTLYQSLADANQLFSRGEIDVAPWYSGRAWALKAEGAPVDIVRPKEGALVLPYVAVIPKDAPNREEALKFLNFILERDQQQAVAEAGYIPFNKNAVFPASLKENLGASSVKEIEDELYVPDWNAVVSQLSGNTAKIEEIISK